VTADFSIKSRNNKELRQNFPELEELKNLTENTVLDGEIITIKEGNADFQTVIERSKATSAYEIRFLAQEFPATYVVFDIIEKDGNPLINLPLIERKRVLKESLKEGKNVVLSVFVEEEGEAYYEAALEKGLEGIMAKKKTSLYEPGMRSGNWLKIKKIISCDCAIFGYTKGEGKRQEVFGALILGLYDGERPVYVGKVGTGFSEDEMQSLLARFETLETQENTLEGVEVPEEIVWLKPLLVCEVAYQTVTKDGKLRMPRFRGLRIDKRPEECTIDQIKQSSLEEYVSRRDFSVTPEPLDTKTQEKGRVFVVQEHHARRLHYDLRLEREGVLRSWAVPKGIPTQSGEKRLAVQTEDHPLDYRKFEGTIPLGQYGAGTVRIWDKGNYDLKVWAEDKIEFTLNGERLRGKYVLAKFKKAGEKDWLLLKTRD
jgi:DNA ligase D-like protein (predicted ligase)/DNA ligase D-like protein (predicted 3'-phosphoesterase)